MKVSGILSALSLITAFAAFSTDASAKCEIDLRSCSLDSAQWIEQHLYVCKTGKGPKAKQSCQGAIKSLNKWTMPPKPPANSANCLVTKCD